MRALLQGAMVVALGMVVVALTAWIYLGFYAVPLFNEKISALTHRKVSIHAVYPAFPFSIVGKGLEIEGLGTIGKFRADVDWLVFFRRDVNIFSIRINDPAIVLERGEGGAFRVTPGTPAVSASAHPEILFRRVFIHNGTVNLRKNSGRVLTIEKIEADLSNVPLSGQPVRTDFFAVASLAKLKIPFAGGSLKTQGWINWAARDMDAKAEVVNDDGLMRANVNLVSSKNDLLCEGKIFLAGGNRHHVKDEEAGVVQNVVRDVLESSQTDIDADFSFRTKMDHVEIGPVSLKGNITTGLNSSETSASIVQSLKAIGEQFLKEDPAAPELK